VHIRSKSGQWEDFLKILDLFNLGIVGRKETISVLYHLLGDCEVFEKLREFMNITTDDFEKFKNVVHTGPGINETTTEDESDDYVEDESNDERVGSYYWEEDNSTYSGQSDLEKKVINTHWVSQPPRHEDYKFKSSVKNQYEENLFECEDGRFELDLLMERTKELKQNLVKLESEWKNLGPEKRSEQTVDEVVGILSMSYLQRFYGDEGVEVLKLLHLHPLAVIPTILTMLQRKEEEMNTVKPTFTQKWSEVVAENLPKSSDYSAFNALNSQEVNSGKSKYKETNSNNNGNNNNNNENEVNTSIMDIAS
jgi:paired amphipathic helix protein Sin3a